jgi:pyruvate kinase
MRDTDTPRRRRTRIVCTIGPATATPERVRELVAAGMDVARLNFSHGTREEHRLVHGMVRAAAREAGRDVGILADLQGPKIRLGTFVDGSAEWATGEEVRVTVADCPGTHDRVSTTYAGLAADARAGDRLLVDDGKVGLRVTEVDGDDVVCRVTEGGTVSNHKGLSLPGMNVSVPALSDKDVADLEFALGLGVDIVALSFVRSPADIDGVLRIMDKAEQRVPVVAKLEKPEAIDNLEAIVLTFDGVMVARGDLGVELPLQDVPLVQKRIVQTARENAKPVIVATQMLESMIVNSRPTRAEASDVANAVLDGADAVMLSGETGVGRHPVTAVETMATIVEAVEQGSASVPPLLHVPRTHSGVIASAARDIGERLAARALVAYTQSGDTVRRVARLHPRMPLLALTPSPGVLAQLTMSWGVQGFLVAPATTTDEVMGEVDRALLALPRFQHGDLVVVVAGSPPGAVGSTNLVRVHRLGMEDS